MSAVLPSSQVPIAPSTSADLSAPLHGGIKLNGEDRLTASRETMRVWLESLHGGKRSKGAAAQAWRTSWFNALMNQPIVAVAMSAASGWWANHPLRAVAALADGAARSSLGPAVRKQPLAVVGIGLVVGAAAVWLRPWRWILRPALFVGLASQVVNRVIAEMPLDTVMKLFTAFTTPVTSKPVSPVSRDESPL